MLDIKFIRENPEAVKENIRKKFQDEKLPLVDRVLVLDEEKIGANAVFRIKGCDKSCIAARLDVVESLLRRGIQGITIEEVQLV